MNQVLQELDKFNKTYKIETFLNRIEGDFAPKSVSKLNGLQKFELHISQDYFNINSYELLDISLVQLENLDSFSITKKELVDYILTRLKTNLSKDRIYFFYELLLYYCEQKDKKKYAILTIQSLKDCLHYKIKNENDNDLILRLFTRFIVISKRFKLEESSFIKKIINGYLLKIDIQKDFYITLYFFEFVFAKYDKKMLFLTELISFYESFVRMTNDKILCNPYDPYKRYAQKIAEIFELVNDYTNKVKYYKKEIDNTLLYCEDITVSNVMRNQSIVQSNLLISGKKIKSKYKFKELTVLAKKISEYISKNYEKFFSSVKDEELSKKIKEYFDSVNNIFQKIENPSNKIDYIIYEIFHFEFYTIKFENWNKERKKGFFETFFPSTTRIDHKGYIHNISNEEMFLFFNTTVDLTNRLYLYLDYYSNWVKVSKSLLLEDINKLKLIDKQYKKQFKKAIRSFCNGNYIEFMYMAPTVIEIILKGFIEKIDGKLFSLKGNSLEEKTLTQVLNSLREDDNSYLDNYILHYISFILVDKEGLNLRNNVLHGNFVDGAFNKYNAMFIYVVLIYLIRYFVNDEDEK